MNDVASPRTLTVRRARWLVLLAAPFLWLRLGELAFVEPTEGRYAEIGREMLESGDWVTPHLNYQRHLEKPPFAYWMAALGIRCFGADNFGARFFAATFGALLVWLAFEIAAFLYGALAGLLAALVLLAHILFFVIARSLSADVFVTAWGAGAVYCFLRWYAVAAAPAGGDPRGWRWAYFACLGGGLLAKGPVVFLHAVLPVAVFLALRREWAILRRLRWGRGLLFSLAFVVPWMILLERGTPGAFEYLVLRKSTGALTSSQGYHREAPWYYIPGLVFGCMPWSFFLPAFWFAEEPGREGDAGAPGEPAPPGWARTFLFVWWPTIFLAFTAAAAKLMTYLLPITVPIAVMNARLWSGFARGRAETPSLSVGVGAYAWFALVGAWTLAALVLPWLGPQGKTLAAYEPAFGLLPLLVGAGVAYLVGVWALRSPARRRWIPVLTAAYLFALFHVGIGVRSRTEVQFSSVEPIGRYLQAHAGPRDPVVCYRCFIRSMPFYTRRRVYLVDYQEKEDDVFDRSAPGFAEYVLTGQETLMALVRAAEPVWIVTKVKYRDQNPDLAAATREVDRNGSVVLLTNR